MIDEKESLYRELSAGQLTPLAGLERLVHLLRKRGLPVALATSAPAENVPHTLGEIGLLADFPHVVRSDEVPRGKPAPDVFLAAAARLGLPPDDCLAFEDAPMGVESALAAGLTCVAVTTSFEAEAFAAHGPAPDFTVSDYEGWLERFGGWLEG
jgi:beta-phosphoglucomutase